MISYALRFVIILHASLLGLLFKLQKTTPAPGDYSVLILTVVLMLIVLGLLIADWITRKEQTRRFSMLIDSVVGIGWLMTISLVVLLSMSMGTL